VQRFPFDTIKIDRSFVREVTEDNGSSSIIEVVISRGNLSMRFAGRSLDEDTS
jgi:EAL domain-containing protein (putative c-di-GMP-specific phosphodiesterase class I)